MTLPVFRAIIGKTRLKAGWKKVLWNRKNSIMVSIASRRKELFDLIVANETYGIQRRAEPIVKFELGEDRAANAGLRHLAGWFDRPHPDGQPLRLESDFTAQKIALALARYRERLEADTVTAVRRFFTGFDFSSTCSAENQVLRFHAARLVAGREFPEAVFPAFGNRSGAELAGEDAAFLKEFIRSRVRRGREEADSSRCLVSVWQSLLLCFDYARDEELSRLAENMMNLLLAEFFQKSPDGCCGGAQGRIGTAEALDHAAAGTYALGYLYGGVGSPGLIRECLVDAVLSKFEPLPEVAAIAHWKPAGEAVIREGGGGRAQYTLRSADYVIGSVVRREACAGDGDGRHDWDVTLRGGSTRSRIFSHHPGNTDGHDCWTGDAGCGCGRFFQNRSAVLALYDIPADQPCRYIHAYLPKMEFLDVVETPEIIFVSTPGAYAALILTTPWRWTGAYEYQDREIVCDGAVNGVICEAAEASGYRSFAEFQAEIRENTWSLDRDHLRLTYVSKRCGAMELRADGSRWLDGVPADTDYPLIDSPLIHSDWDSGEVKLTVPGFEPLVLVF